jgi:hypothetical protein
MYSLRWQIELVFKELKSTLGFAQYSFKKFLAVEAWVGRQSGGVQLVCRARTNMSIKSCLAYWRQVIVDELRH